MPWNDKSLRLRGLRDRLHLTGQHAPTFNQSIDIIVEVLGLVHSPRNLSYARRDIQKLRDKNPNMTLEQLQKFEFLEQKLARKVELARTRKERSAETRARKKPVQPTPAPVAPAPTEEVW